MNERIVILGGGESGIGAALLASKRGAMTFLSDAGAITEARQAILNENAIEFEQDGHSLERILEADCVVKSPGIPDTTPLILELETKGIPVISEIEYGYKYLPSGAKVVAITGTNGKTTTTLLTHHLLEQAGLNVALAGNVGTSLAGLVAEGDHDYYVIEVSSFQLDGIKEFRPDVAVLLNITPDHLDRYNYDFGNYVSSKFRIAENLTSQQSFIYCSDSSPIINQIGLRQIEARLLDVTATESSNASASLSESHLAFNYEYHGAKEQYEVALADLTLIGKHNMINSMAAVLSAFEIGLSKSEIDSGLRSFKNAAHRLEYVDEINGIRFINDSKATNVDAVFYALDGVKTNIIWMVGGIDKGNDYSQLTELVKNKVKGIVCLGKDNSRIRDAFGASNVPFKETEDVNEAVRMSQDMASQGDTVLLSPACSSFDLFKNYENRGDLFKQAVVQLKESVEA